MKKTTEELMNEIQNSPNASLYFSENEDEMSDMSLSLYLQTLLEKYHLKRANLFRKAGLVGSNYGYEIFHGTKNTPSRDILIMICLAFPLTIEETQHVLRCGKLSILYPRDKRDAYVLYALTHKLELDTLNDLLTQNGLPIFN
ncbi:MAG: XRE family transcriptional regulator [Lachnospiraceae bacterium]|nr:XRE family transcriptional regulator [Lachnospiraceae bacterium]